MYTPQSRSALRTVSVVGETSLDDELLLRVTFETAVFATVFAAVVARAVLLGFAACVDRGLRASLAAFSLLLFSAVIGRPHNPFVGYAVYR